jgi:hypothetical protein
LRKARTFSSLVILMRVKALQLITQSAIMINLVLTALSDRALRALIFLDSLSRKIRRCCPPPPSTALLLLSSSHVHCTYSLTSYVYNCLPVRLMIYREICENPSLGKNLGTNKNALVKDRVNTAFSLMLIKLPIPLLYSGGKYPLVRRHQSLNPCVKEG